MKGEALKDFEKKSNQDFGAEEWCICLHLFDEQGGKKTYPNADISEGCFTLPELLKQRSKAPL